MRKPKLNRRPASQALRRIEMTDNEIRAAIYALRFVLVDPERRARCIGNDCEKVSALAVLSWSVDGRQ